MLDLSIKAEATLTCVQLTAQMDRQRNALASKIFHTEASRFLKALANEVGVFDRLWRGHKDPDHDQLHVE